MSVKSSMFHYSLERIAWIHKIYNHKIPLNSSKHPCENCIKLNHKAHNRPFIHHPMCFSLCYSLNACAVFQPDLLLLCVSSITRVRLCSRRSYYTISSHFRINGRHTPDAWPVRIAFILIFLFLLCGWLRTFHFLRCLVSFPLNNRIISILQ